MATVSHHDINRYLGALATTFSDGIFYYIYQKAENDGNLTGMSFSNDRWSREELVGSAKNGSPAEYVVDNGAKKRVVFYVDKDNKVGDYEYYEEDGEWSPGTLKDLGFVAHPKTKLAGVNNSGTIIVYAQDNSGSIQSLSRAPGGDSWSRGPTLPARPAPGANLSAVVLNDSVSVYYQHQDSTIHQCSFENGSWNDSEVENTSGRTCNGRLFALTFDGNNGVVFFEGQAKEGQGNEFYQLTDGKATSLGHMKDGELKPTTTAESGSSYAPWGRGYRCYVCWHVCCYCYCCC